jgi:hypothetical protein
MKLQNAGEREFEEKRNFRAAIKLAVVADDLEMSECTFGEIPRMKP